LKRNIKNNQEEDVENEQTNNTLEDKGDASCTRIIQGDLVSQNKKIGNCLQHGSTNFIVRN
jgi:hypothetical protein